MSFLTPAFRDLGEALQRFHLWLALGNIDIKQRYQRSILGPFWLTINMGALIFGVGYIYASIFNSLHSDYIPYLAAGIVTWNFILATLLEGSTAFISAAVIMKNVTVSKFVYVLHALWRNVLIFLHNVLIMLPVYAIYGFSAGWGVLAALAGAVLVTLFLAAASLLLAVAAARYRDVPPAVAGILQLAFFATPIIWEAGALKEHRWIVDFNPVHHLIESIREPLLSGTIPWLSFAVTAGSALLAAALAILVYARARRRIVYWV